MKFRYDPSLCNFAKELRKQGTVGEAMLWLQLKGSQRRGFRFHRQKPLGRHVVDFWSPKLRLAIEIDGGTHDNAGAQLRDAERQRELESLGVCVLRFTERDVQTNLEGVVAVIDRWIEERVS